jgi:hypothetical protein
LGPLEIPNIQCAESGGGCYCGAKHGPKPSTLQEGCGICLRSAAVHVHTRKYTLSVPSKPERGRCPLFNVDVHNVPSVGLVLVLR